MAKKLIDQPLASNRLGDCFRRVSDEAWWIRRGARFVRDRPSFREACFSSGNWTAPSPWAGLGPLGRSYYNGQHSALLGRYLSQITCASRLLYLPPTDVKAPGLF